MTKKIICIIIVVGCISSLLGITFANFNKIKNSFETIMENNAIEIWKYKTEIEILGNVLKTYFVDGKNTNVSYYSDGPNYLNNATITVGEWGSNERTYRATVPASLTNQPTKIARDIVYKYNFLSKITYSQYENEVEFGDGFFADFFRTVQTPIVIISLLATIVIIIITMVIDAIGITFNLFDLVFSLFNIE